MRNLAEIKPEFKKHVNNFLNDHKAFKFLLFDIFVEGTAYIVGGYFRDFLFHRKSRDLDIIVDLPNSVLMEKVTASGIEFKPP